jgi:hypothetical protein
VTRPGRDFIGESIIRGAIFADVMLWKPRTRKAYDEMASAGGLQFACHELSGGLKPPAGS